ncbi:hypothetical protein [Nostoc sp. 'Peltigera membranacea cyanobiont' 210A]|nr:hypothetical protein [Nostoc sp. 'Peltigera membranacea cyanobiont' 210A]
MTILRPVALNKKVIVKNLFTLGQVSKSDDLGCVCDVYDGL